MESKPVSIRQLFPRASKSMIEANPQLAEFVEHGQKAQAAVDELTKKPKPRGVRLPNQTEREFGVLLAAQKVRGEIIRYEFEGIRLKWGVDEKTGAAMWYKPDWFVVVADAERWAKCIEIKGAHIWQKDIVRFKGCRADWSEFDFEMWQKMEGRWNRLL